MLAPHADGHTLSMVNRTVLFFLTCAATTSALAASGIVGTWSSQGGKATLRLRADHTFTRKEPMVLQHREFGSGTWVQHGKQVELRYKGAKGKMGFRGEYRLSADCKTLTPVGVGPSWTRTGKEPK